MRRMYEEMVDAFRRIELVDGIMTEYKHANPERSDVIDGSFAMMQPRGEMILCSDHLLDAHCRELLDRVISDGDLTEATNAEVLFVFMGATVATKVQLELVMAYERLFSITFPNSPLIGDFIDGAIGDRYGSVVDKMISDTRKSLRDKTRFIKSQPMLFSGGN
jgi:hypothetical protein